MKKSPDVEGVVPILCNYCGKQIGLRVSAERSVTWAHSNQLCRESMKEQIDALHQALGFSSAWTAPDVLRILAESEDHLRNDHDCDRDGHEKRLYAKRAAELMADDIERAIGRRQ